VSWREAVTSEGPNHVWQLRIADVEPEKFQDILLVDDAVMMLPELVQLVVHDMHFEGLVRGRRVPEHLGGLH
jgi:hypothetical protein